MKHIKTDLNELRRKILETSCQAQAGHIPSAFSILEIVLTLYKEHLSKKDIFVLSKGHGCLALYVVLLEMGFITGEEFYSFTQYSSILGGHPDRNKHPEIYASTGSLGHGLPICVGAALARQIENKTGTVYCLIGDGECNEGTIWESAMVANNLNLTNLVCIVDNNSSQIRSLPSTNLSAKFKAFGWGIIEVAEGHNLRHIGAALSAAADRRDLGPICIICDTVKGKGIREMEENMFAWHHGAPTEEQYLRFCEELRA